VPAVLLSGHHADIARWRRDQSLALTARRRPDLIAAARAAGRLSKADEQTLARLGL
jgi:tRNA (guanine37-N1)-methyltransferase